MVKKGYYSNGQLHYKESYRKGKLHGLSKWWHIDGQLYYEALYQEDKLYGMEKVWDGGGGGGLASARYFLYGDRVSEEEFRKHEAIRKLAGL